MVVTFIFFNQPIITLANGDDQLQSFIQNAQKNNDIQQKIEPKSIQTDLGNGNSILSHFDSWIGPIYNLGINFLTILFLAAVITMAFGRMTKTGHWLKWASGTMIFSFIALMVLRIGPLLVLTVNAIGFTLIVTDLVHLLEKVSLWVAVGMIFVGLVIRLFHKVVSNHPEYFRWSRNLFTGSAVLACLSFVIPIVFKVV